MNVTFLGTGTSHGVPMIGCECAVCRSTDPRDARLRPSMLVRTPATAVLVDAGPDLRAQALRHAIRHVDAILFTHGHADHILGIDDVRRFNVAMKGPMPCYGDARTLDDIRRTFSLRLRPGHAQGRRTAGARALRGDRRAVRVGDLTVAADSAVARRTRDPRVPLRRLRVSDRLQPDPGRGLGAARGARRPRARRAARARRTRRIFHSARRSRRRGASAPVARSSPTCVTICRMRRPTRSCPTA